MTHSTDAAVCRDAAKAVEDMKAGFCCCALGLPGDKIRDDFAAIFSPEPSDEQEQDNLSVYGWYGRPNTEENRNARVVALCMMAAMVEAGDA